MSTIENAAPRTHIPISGISAALHEEWASLSAEVEHQTGVPPLRANTSTLVVIVKQGFAVDSARHTLHQLASAIPSRILFFVVDPDCETPTASIWAHCTLTARGKTGGCYDVIEIALPSGRIPAIPNIVSVHRLGELPTFVIWIGQADIRSPDFAALSTVADRLVIDTESFNEPMRALSDYAMYLGTTGSTVLGSDLAWTRISTWRELIAQSFDPPGTRPFAMNIRSVDVTYDESQTAGAILLASWLAARLGLEPVNATDSPSTMELRATSPTSPSRVTFNLHHSHRSGVGIRSVRILARSEDAIARISIIKSAGGNSTVRVESPGMPRQERVVHHMDPPRQELVAAELMRYTRGRIYEEALSCAAQYCRRLESNRA